MKSRQEHMEWCKKRAIEYAKQGDIQGAMASMTSDLQKHPDTQGHIAIELMLLQVMGGLISTPAQMIHFIEGFN